MAGELRVGVTAPWNFTRLSPADQRSTLTAVADAGIDHLFTADHVSFHGGHGMDGLMTMAAYSGMEPRLGMHVGVFLLALRHPMVAARQIATLADIAPGRLTVGIGVGGEDRHEFEVCEVDPGSRGRRTDVGLGLVRRLLDGETVDGDGEFYDFTAGVIRPSPSPRVPFVVGGRSDAALRRAGTLGDGLLGIWSTAQRFGSAAARVEEVGDEVGRGDIEWQHGMQIWVGIGDGPDDGRTNVAETMGRFYNMPFEPFAKYVPVGNAEQIAETLAPYVDAGASTLNLTPCGPDPLTAFETIAEVKRLLLR
ncbi:MAG: LLM class flavin-dependent oxidoreductase [Actinomycetota bacterium]